MLRGKVGASALRNPMGRGREAQEAYGESLFVRESKKPRGSLVWDKDAFLCLHYLFTAVLFEVTAEA